MRAYVVDIAAYKPVSRRFFCSLASGRKRQGPNVVLREIQAEHQASDVSGFADGTRDISVNCIPR